MTKTIKKSVAFLSAAVMVMAMLMYFPSGTFSNIDWGIKASAAETITPKQPTEGDGSTENPYKIGTAAELYWFAALVNGDKRVSTEAGGQNTAANAVLTADITVNSKLLDSLIYDETTGEVTNSENFTSWSPIGNSTANKYIGIFDGQNHKISGLYFNEENTNYVGLFGYVGSGGKVSNVGVEDSYFNGLMLVGGVSGENYGTISNCYNMGEVSGTDYVGGVCGWNEGTITNCYNTGAVNGTSYNVGGVCGVNWSGIITNCYYDSTVYSNGKDVGDNSGTVTNVEGKTTAQFKSGEVAYLLSQGCTIGEGESAVTYDGSVWGQDLSVENSYPVLDGTKTVYQINVYAGCEGNPGEASTGYSNTDAAVYVEHNYSNGICGNCKGYEPAKKNSKGEYEISNAGQLYWFADKVNNENATYGSANAVLTADIIVNKDLLLSLEDDTKGNVTNGESFTSWTPIGNITYKYTGTFDGQNHTVSGLYFNDSSTDNVGLFGYVYNSSVSNVGVVDSYFKGNNYVGGVCGYSVRTEIINCYNTGAVSGSTNVGGVCGSSDYTGIKNCYNIGNVTATGNETNYVGGVCGNNYNGTITNCYYLADTADENGGKTTDEFGKGEVAYLLSQGCTIGEGESAVTYDGSVWGQEIGKDDYPVLGGAKVYQVNIYAGCEGNPGEPTYSYSNTEKDPVYADHTDVDDDGKCDTCSKYMDNIGARLVGHSLTLDGSVGVNFYMELSSEVISDGSAYMEFTLPGGKTSIINVSDANTEVISGKTYYKFRCQVNAAEMTDTIKAQLKSTVGNSKVYEYTVKEYADYLFAHKEDNAEFAKAANLIEAMVNYGSYAQIYAGYNAENLAVGDAGNLKSVDDVTIGEYTYTPNANETKVQFAGANLSLLSTTTLRMYFRLSNVDVANVTFTYGGNTLEKTQSGDYYYVELVGIPASKLDDDCVVTVNDGTNSFDVTYTPMAYCANVVNRETTETRTESLKNLIKALVLYNRAADAYIPED